MKSIKHFLIFFSLAFLAYGLPQRWIMLLLLFLAFANFQLLGWVCEGQRSRSKRLAYYSLIFLNFAPLLLLKTGLFQPTSLYPAGVTLFVLQLTSYLVDTWRRPQLRGHGFADLLLYLFYLPKFFVGPLERFASFMGSVERASLGNVKRNFPAGLYLVGGGLFKAVVLARELKRYTSQTSMPENFGWLSSGCIILLSAMQLYCEFSGYVDIGRGLSGLMGIELSRNFNFPVLARNPQDFYYRWHISLTHWLRDYIFYPVAALTGNLYLATALAIFPVSLWHGANGKFVLAGIYQVAGVLLYMQAAPLRAAVAGQFSGRFSNLYSVSTHLLMVAMGALALFFLVAPDFTFIRQVLGGLTRPDSFYGGELLLRLLFLACPLIVLERILLKRGGQETELRKKDFAQSALVAAYFSFLILYFNAEKGQSRVEFLYFQF